MKVDRVGGPNGFERLEKLICLGAALLHTCSGGFHLVLTDLYMPVMDGFQLIEKMRSEPALKAIPVVAISAGGTDAREKAEALGVNVFMKKPVRFAEVMETVKRLLEIK